MERFVRRPEVATTSESAQMVADRALASRVQAALAADDEARRWETRVVARAGVVEVETVGLADKVEAIARGVRGAREVRARAIPIVPVPPIPL